MYIVTGVCDGTPFHLFNSVSRDHHIHFRPLRSHYDYSSDLCIRKTTPQDDMTRKMLSEVLLLSAMLQQTSAQLLSCSEIDCPLSYGSARCTIDNTTLTQLGVANFSSSLSTDPLTWTIGYAPEAFTNTTDERIYYLSTPRGFDLDTRADVTGCAMFFIGAEGGLSFLKPDGTDQDYGASDGTCADALGSTCVADLTNQGRNLASNSIALGNFQCSDIALAIQTSPPESCTKAGTWGNITAMGELYSVHFTE
jgi:hypothetical protein